jgi:hypothetical protein
MAFKFFTGIEKELSFSLDQLIPNEDCYSEGWSTAQLGLPLNENPHPIGSNQSSMWECGWNDFVDNH